MKTKNTFYNSITALLYYFLTIFLGIINRKGVISILGIEYQGINSLFSNVLSMLSIAELGIGTAIIYHLYRPLAEKNIKEIQSLMNFYRKCYQTIAAVILLLGLALVPFLDFFVEENVLPYELWFIYIWFLLDVVISYLFTFKRSILIADQKNYIILLCDLLYQITVKLGQVLVLWITHNFIGYLIVMVVSRFAENLLINALANRKYPYIKNMYGEPLGPDILADIKQKVKGAVFHKVGSFIVLGTDNILISKYLGLVIVGIYSNYFLVINSIKNICNQVMSAATASVGHMLTEKNEEKNRRIFMEMQILNMFLNHCAAAGIYCVATPFVSLVFGEKFVVSEFTLFILSLNFYIQGMRCVYAIFKETSGILYEDRFIPLIESLLNVAASILLLKRFGLAGVFMGTIFSSTILFAYTYPVLVVKNVLKDSLKKYFRDLLWLLSLNLFSMITAKWICNIFVGQSGMIQILCNGMLSVIVSAVIYILGFAVWRKESRMLVEKIRNLI